MTGHEAPYAQVLRDVAEEAGREFAERRTPRWDISTTGTAHCALDNDPRSLCDAVAMRRTGPEIAPEGVAQCPTCASRLDTAAGKFVGNAIDRFEADRMAERLTDFSGFRSFTTGSGKTQLTAEVPADPPALTPTAARLLLELLDLAPGGGES